MRKILFALMGLSAFWLAFYLNPDGIWAKEGTQMWVFKTGGSVVSSPAIGPDGTIFVGSNDGNLYALHPEGGLKWRFTTRGAVHSRPAIGSDGTIYIGSWDHTLYAINPDGSMKWFFVTEGEINASPTIGPDGTIYIGSWDHNLYAINSDGSLKWKFPTDGEFFSTPAIGPDGTLYIGCWNHFIYAIKEGEGRSLVSKTPGPEEKKKPEPSRFLEIFPVIQEIKVEITPEGEEKVLIRLTPFNRPRYSVLNGDRPRLICDFMNASLGSGMGRPIEVNGKILRQIRMAYHKGSRPKVRVVLDLRPDQIYTADQAILEDEKIYSIVIRPAKGQNTR